MSRRCRTVAPSYPEPAISGTYCVIGASGSRRRLRGEDSADTPHDGLRDRHQQVRRVGPHLTEVTFEDDLTVVQHDDGVGPRVRQHLPDGGRTGTEPRHGDVVESRWVVGSASAFARAPRAMRCVGTISRRCWKDHRLKGGSCQLPRLTTDSGGGGKPAIRASDIPRTLVGAHRRPRVSLIEDALRRVADCLRSATRR